MTDNEERIKTETDAVTGQDPVQEEIPPQKEEIDPYVGITVTDEEPPWDPIEEQEKYVYQKGDFWAFLLAGLRVFVPILLLFFGGIMLVVWFFSR